MIAPNQTELLKLYDENLELKGETRFMNKIDWKSKLTSRKFWAAIAEFVTMLILAFHGTEETAVQISAIIMAGASVVAYIIGEGLIDAASAKSNTVILPDYEADEETEDEVDGE